jgi:acyl-CoA thioesterase FadM
MLRATHTSTVTEDQIDHLGHMNVRFYAVNAHAGTRAVLADLPGWGDRPFEVDDTYTRHRREQLLGTDLEVRSAVLSATESELRLHHELRNAGTDELAATFVHGLRPLGADGLAAAVPADVVAVAAPEAIEQPEYAAPRTISLDHDLLAATPSLELVLERGLAMRQPRLVTAEECDERGRYRVEMAPMLTWAGEPVGGQPGDALNETSSGQLMGWAAMETRIQVGTLPHVGERIQSFGASVALHDKVMHRVHWVYDADTGVLLTAFENVSMAFDIRARRPMSIPDGYRQREEERVHPDLAPRALA